MKKFLTLLFSVSIVSSLSAQQSVGIGTASPNASAQLDVSSTTKGFLMPRMTSAQRTAIATPAAGLMVYETTTSSVWVYNGSSWLQIASGGVSPWIVSGTNIYNSNTGNVGVGTTVPTSKFHIAGTALIENGTLDISDNVPTVKLKDGSTLLGFLKIQSGGDLHLGTYVTSNPTGRVMFDIEGSSKMTLDHNGDLGIGTISPNYKLDVRGDMYADGNLLIDDGYIRLNNTTNTKNWQLSNSSSLGGRLLFLQQGLERLVLQNDGNVGIGGVLPLTNNGFPETKLHIESGQDAGLTSSNNGYLMLGPSSGTNIVIDNNEIIARNGYTGTSTLYLQNSGGEIFTAARTTIDKSGEALRLTGSTPYINFTNNGSSVNGFISQTSSSLFIGENNGKIQIDGTQVAIGGISNAVPAYKLTVTGKVICEEVRVKLSSAWPDYVFDDAHQLLPIEKLSQFIQTNRHLPNIPSAESIEKEGMELGDMQKRMMEKIEELTLYIIQQQKEIELLKSQMPKSDKQ